MSGQEFPFNLGDVGTYWVRGGGVEDVSVVMFGIAVQSAERGVRCVFASGILGERAQAEKLIASRVGRPWREILADATLQRKAADAVESIKGLPLLTCDDPSLSDAVLLMHKGTCIRAMFVDTGWRLGAKLHKLAWALAKRFHVPVFYSCHDDPPEEDAPFAAIDVAPAEDPNTMVTVGGAELVFDRRRMSFSDRGPSAAPDRTMGGRQNRPYGARGGAKGS